MDSQVIKVQACTSSEETAVKFPYQPYPIQRDFVTKLVQSLESGGNALLESPTGTGKTACLLCGSLSWQKQYVNSIISSEVHQKCHQGKQRAFDGHTGFQEQDHFSGSKPKILYSSRTHSQLSQAIGELKKIGYPNTKAVVIGSRDQLCIHPEVKQESNATIKTHLCRQKVRSRTCVYYNNFEKARDGWLILLAM